MALLRAVLSDETRSAHEFAVDERSNHELVFGIEGKACPNLIVAQVVVGFDGGAKGKGLAFESFQTKPPPCRSVVCFEHSNLNWGHLQLD